MPGWSTFRSYGGGVSGVNSLQYYGFSATRDGETLTWESALYVTAKAGNEFGNVVALSATPSQIYGVA